MSEMRFYISDETPNSAAPPASLLSLKSWGSSTLWHRARGSVNTERVRCQPAAVAQPVPGLPEAPGGVVKMHWGGEEAVRKKREESLQALPEMVPKTGGQIQSVPKTGHAPWLPLLIPMGKSEPYLVSIDLSPLIVYTHFWDTLYEP